MVSTSSPPSGRTTSAAERIAETAARRPAHPALRQDAACLTYGELDGLLDRVAAALQRDGVAPGHAVAICAANSLEYAVVFLGAVRAGVAVALLPQSAKPDTLIAMLNDAGASHLFVDTQTDADIPASRGVSHRVRLDGDDDKALERWLAPAGSKPEPVVLQPEWPFDIIYSSGTTGTPKGIVQPFSMRSMQLQGGSSTLSGYGPDAITLLSTPLYSNTTLVSFFSTLGNGGTAVLMAKFDPARYLALAEEHRITHTMLVPAQYQRLLAHPDFDHTDFSAMRTRQSTGAPFPPALKAEVLRRWPGRLIDSYGMTEGGGVCLLEADRYPQKLHTVGKPLPGHDFRLLDDTGNDVAPGEAGEVVAHSPGMMTGYLNQPAKTAEAQWFDAEGRRYIRTGDIGRFDEDGFLVLVDRKKDMIISGGFNLYPSDIEAELRQHPAVADASVVGVPSTRWGETPVAFVVTHTADAADAAALLAWANSRLGKMQRLADLRLTDNLPRNTMGKVLKRELREAYVQQVGTLA